MMTTKVCLSIGHVTICESWQTAFCLVEWCERKKKQLGMEAPKNREQLCKGEPQENRHFEQEERPHFVQTERERGRERVND